MFLHIPAGPRAGGTSGPQEVLGANIGAILACARKVIICHHPRCVSGQSWGARAEPQVPDDAVTVAWRARSASALADCFAYPHFLAVAAPSFAGTERPLSARTLASAAVRLAVRMAPQKSRGQRDSAASAEDSVGRRASAVGVGVQAGRGAAGGALGAVATVGCSCSI